jgi:hypothetical protein
VALHETETASSSVSAAARAAIVNRTHRVVRERAMEMQKQKKSRRELVLPLLICSAVLLLLCYAGSVVASGSAFCGVESQLEHRASRLFSGQTMDTGSPAFILLFWFLPITVVTVVAVYLRRNRSSRDRGRDGGSTQLRGRFRNEVTR